MDSPFCFHATCTHRLVVIILNAHTSCDVLYSWQNQAVVFVMLWVYWGVLLQQENLHQAMWVLLRPSKERFGEKKKKKKANYLCTYKAEQNFGDSDLIELTHVSLNLSAQNNKWIFSPTLAVMMQRVGVDRRSHHNDSVFSVAIVCESTALRKTWQKSQPIFKEIGAC